MFLFYSVSSEAGEVDATRYYAQQQQSFFFHLHFSKKESLFIFIV